MAISTRKLPFFQVGRPAVTLLGACLMVMVGSRTSSYGLPPAEALLAVDPNTIALLAGMMILAAVLESTGFFELISSRVLLWAEHPVPLLYAVTIGSGLLSALLVNDAVCLLATPFVMMLCTRTGAPRTPFVLAVAMGANAGSAMTLAGNPQNMLVAQLSGISYIQYTIVSGPAAFAALLTTAIGLHILFRKDLNTPRQKIETPQTTVTSSPQLWASLLALLSFTIAALSGAHLAFSAVAAASLALLATQREASTLLRRVDWTVLIFFSGLFILVAALRKTGLPAEVLTRMTDAFPPQGATGFTLLLCLLIFGSQVVSNVPLILLITPWIQAFQDQNLAWILTALVSTLAGNLTLLGSVANIIVIERAKAQDEVGFLAYTKIGLPITLFSLLAALFVIWATHSISIKTAEKEVATEKNPPNHLKTWSQSSIQSKPMYP